MSRRCSLARLCQASRSTQQATTHHRKPRKSSKVHPTENRMARQAPSGRPPGTPDRVNRLTAGPRPSRLVLGQLPLELAPPFHRRALTELLQLEQLADLDLPFGLGLTAGLKRKPLGPVDGLLHRRHLKDPVAGDDLLGLVPPSCLPGLRTPTGCEPKRYLRERSGRQPYGQGQLTLAGGRLPALGSGVMAAWVRLVQSAASMVASIARMSS